MQEKMFAEARIEMEKELASGASAFYSNGQYPYSASAFVDEAAHQQMMEQRINETAEALACEFMTKQSSTSSSDIDESNNPSQQPCKEVTKDQARLVYKFLHTPHDLLVAGMSQMQPTQLSQFYRKLAIQLHPDKNHHPQATDAFQVVQAAMETAKSQAGLYQ